MDPRKVHLRDYVEYSADSSEGKIFVKGEVRAIVNILDSEDEEQIQHLVLQESGHMTVGSPLWTLETIIPHATK